MKTVTPDAASDRARQRILANRGEPLFYASWDNAVFIHYETDPSALQKCIPFTLDLYHGRAFVSVVAFTLRHMRPRVGGKLSEWLFKPIATHDFLNVRTYVRPDGESAIYFMAEWLSNRLSVALGPITFGLPYRFGRLDYSNSDQNSYIRGHASGKDGDFGYLASMPKTFSGCEPGSLPEFLLERYTAFTSAGWRKQFFRVWHPPWEQSSLEVKVTASDLLAATGTWWPTSQFVSANYSPGVSVWMGWPHRVASASFWRAVAFGEGGCRCSQSDHVLDAHATYEHKNMDG